MIKQADSAEMQALQLIEQLRPDVVSPRRAHQIEVNQYVRSLVRKYRPEKETILHAELDRFLGEQTRSLLGLLKAGLKNYLNEYAR